MVDDDHSGPDLERDSRQARRPRRRACYIVATTEGAAWACEQLRELRDYHGFDVCAVLNGHSGSLVDRLNAAGIEFRVCDFNFTSSADLLSLPRKVISLYRLLRAERYDIVQTHLFHSMIIGRIASWFADVPVRLSMIAGPFHLEAYTPRWIDRATCWMDTKIIASCEYTRLLYRKMGVSAKRLELIYYGPDEAKFDPARVARSDLRTEFGWPADTPLIGMVAYFYTDFVRSRWIPEPLWGRSVKCHDDLIRATPQILNEFPNAKVLLVGSGWQQPGEDYLRRMKDLVRELGLADSVIFTGYRDDVPGILRDLNVAVQPSLSENLGGTIESLLMLCPTVATRVGGMTDSIVDGRTGVLVEPGDPRSLADGICRLLRDPVQAGALASAGRARMLAGFTLRRTGQALADLYRRELAEDPAGYRASVGWLRLALGSVICSGIVLRYSFLDAWILPRWDAGWRPWRLESWAEFGKIGRFRIYAFVGRYAPSLGLRRRLRAGLSHRPAAPQSQAADGAPRASLGLRHRAVYLKHLTLYRLYAFVGRHAPSPGLRAGLARDVAGLRYAIIHLKHRTIYRFFALVGRKAPSPGLRSSLYRLARRLRLTKSGRPPGR